MLEVYRGSINAWECDEMGHMNVRFYVAKMMEGLAELAHVAGMPQAFRAPVRSTLRPRDQHIRFIGEAHAGKPFQMNACVLEVTDASVLVYQQIDHLDGRICASFRTWIDHVEVGTGIVFPWSPPVRAALEGMKDTPPAEWAPRSIDFSKPPRATARMGDADAIGARTIGRGVIQPHECDLTGKLKPEFFLGRVSDSIGHALGPFRQSVAEAARAKGEELRLGGAVLEYRLAYRRWPAAGDRYVIRTGLGFVKEKVHALNHWLIDPESGEAWATTQAVAIVLDLDKRKPVAPGPELLDQLKAIAPAGLDF